MPDREELLLRQKTLGDFGEFILNHDDLQVILDEACHLIARALHVDFAKIIEIDRATGTGLVRAGHGWRRGIVGEERVNLRERSSESYAIEKCVPVITRNIAAETRFDFPAFMQEHGVAAIVSVPIMLPGCTSWGVLQVDARNPRDFDQEDVEFLRTYAMMLGPVIDRLQALATLAETGDRLRLIVESARSYAIILSDPDDRITDWLGGSQEILGWAADEIIGQPTNILFTPEDRENGIPERELNGARNAGTAPNVRWHQRRDGSRVFLDGQTVALRDGKGSIRGYLKIGQDVTDRRRNEERQAMLLAELQHRVRNVLAMVRSVVRRTVAGAASIDQLGAQLEGRIEALARTQALLTRALGKGVDLEQLIRDELDAQAAGPDRIVLTGPRIELASKAAEVVTLAIHELATNAAKYGALREGTGKLSVLWQIDQEQTPHRLHLVWRESEVELSDLDGRRSGFGTELVTRRVPYELKGEGRIEFRSDGIEAVIDFPLVHRTSILETGEPQ